MFTKDELSIIADLCKKHDVVCVADEVYEWMTYDNSKHIKIGKTSCPLIPPCYGVRAFVFPRAMLVVVTARRFLPSQTEG